MSLDSSIYLLFLALVTVIYWKLRRRSRQNALLLAASYLFYAWWDWRFLLLMAASTCVDYWSARRISASAEPAIRRRFLIASIGLNLGFLGYFKYFHFFVDTFAGLGSLLGMHQTPPSLWKVLLPPAISFYTFQEVAYIVDVYQRKLEPSGSLLEYALFISFFPHLIAGPIQRPGHLLPQVQQRRRFHPQRIFDGCMLIVSGLFRKCVIADSCAQIANAAFDGRMGSSGWNTMLGAYAFAFQIYGDFSGYSDIARGSAQLLGFHFMVNFRQPYLAAGLQDFWRRWHISLSTWLRDYLYVPLGGNRVCLSRTYINLMLTMLIGGLWHGASWNFVLWGGIHGGGLAAERALHVGLPRSQIACWLRRLLTFHLVCFAWIFFRAPSLRASFSMLAALKSWHWMPGYPGGFVSLAVFAASLLAVDLYMEHNSEEYPTQHAAFAWQLTAATLAVLVIAFGAAYEAAPFVYFQF